MTAWCRSSPNFCIRGHGLSDGEVEELKKMEEERAEVSFYLIFPVI
jgi:hypothetical protein